MIKISICIVVLFLVDNEQKVLLLIIIMSELSVFRNKAVIYIGCLLCLVWNLILFVVFKTFIIFMNIRCLDLPHTFLLVLIFVEVIYVKNKFTFTSLMFNKHWKCYYYISNNVKIYVTINLYSHKRDVSLWYLKSLAGG